MQLEPNGPRTLDDKAATIGEPVGTLSEKAYRTLSTMIQERALPSGAPVVEQHLAKMLGISRTPIRQALQRLESEGQLRKTANRSYELRRVELKEYLQSLRVREILEAEAAALAVERVQPEEIARVRAGVHEAIAQRPYNMIRHWASDDEVHNLFIMNSGNGVMMNMLLSLRVTTKLFEIERLSDRLEPDSREHEAILDALEARDPHAARRAVAAHMRSLFEFAVKTVS